MLSTDELGAFRGNNFAILDNEFPLTYIRTGPSYLFRGCQMSDRMWGFGFA